MIVVSDTSAISNLAAIGQLNLLRQLYESVIIPSAVYQELLNSGATDSGVLAVQIIIGHRTDQPTLQLDRDTGRAR